MAEAFKFRRSAASELTADEADDLFAPEVTQASHGFAVGDVIRRTGASAWTKAQADSVANMGVDLSIVVHVEDASTFSLLRYYNAHALTLTSHGLGASGTKLYLSTSTAGALTGTEPAAGSRLYCGEVIDANTIRWGAPYLVT